MTKPRTDQLRFLSQANGEVILDAYIEAAEKGGRSLGDILADMWDNDGLLRADIFQMREDPSDPGVMQFRVGDFVDPNAGWVDVTNTDFQAFVDEAAASAASATASASSATTSKNAAAASATAANNSAIAAAASAADAANSVTGYVTVATTQDITGLKTVKRSTAASAAEYMKFQPTDFAVGKPYLVIQKPASATQWELAIWDGSTSTGTINISASAFTWGGSQVVNLSTAQTLTNKTMSGGTLTGTITNTATMSGLMRIANGTSTASADFLQLQPTDYAVGKPQLSVFKTSTAANWHIGLYDGVNSNGQINFGSSALTWNSVQIADLSTAQTLSNKTLSSPALTGVPTAPTAAGGTNTTQIATTAFVAAATGGSGSVTLTGAQTVTGLKTVSIGTAVTQADYLKLSPTDQAVGKPYFYVQKATTATAWSFGIWDGSSNAGSLNISAGSLTFNGIAIPTISSTDTLSNKTLVAPTIGTGILNSAVVSGTFSGSATWTGLQTVSVGNSTTSNHFVQYQPSDYGPGKPKLIINKSTTATAWNIGLYDSATNTGVINIDASSFTWNGSPVATTTDVQVLTNKTLTAPAINGGTFNGTYAGFMSFQRGNATTNQSFMEWKPTDYTTGKPRLAMLKAATASLWHISLYDGVDNAGTINIDSTVLNHNGVKVPTISSTDTLSSKTLLSPVVSGTWTGAATWTGLQNHQLGAATTATDYEIWSPTDYAVGKPRLVISKSATATVWNFGLWDSATNTGTLNLSASIVQSNGQPVATTTDVQTFTNKTLTSPTINGGTTNPTTLQVSGVDVAGVFKLSSTTLSGGSTDIAIPTGYRQLKVCIENVASSLGAAVDTLTAYISTDNGSTFFSTSGNYISLGGSNSASLFSVEVTGNNPAIKAGYAEFILMGSAGSNFPFAQAQPSWRSGASSAFADASAVGRMFAANSLAVTHLRFLCVGSSLNAGTVTIYGLKT